MADVDVCEMLGPEARCNEPMALHTTLAVGGPADVWVPVYGVIELVGAVRVARMLEMPFLVIGEGANLLVADAGIRAVVIENHAQHVIVRWQGETVSVLAESGTPLADLARYCTGRGMGGLEWAVDVPGTVGGAVVGNAGAYGGRMSDLVREASVLTADNRIDRLSADELGFGYRTSRLKTEDERRGERPILLSVEMTLCRGECDTLQAQAAQYTDRRWQRQPPEPSAGSIFKRTADYPAGYLIEQAGLKGLRLGQAQISPRHANVIINLGGATAQDVRTLMEIMRTMVRERFGETLEPEIELCGEWPPLATAAPPWHPA